MVQISSTRQAVPAQKTPILAGALQGLGNHFKMQQVLEDKKREELMQILPVMASMKMLAPSQQGEPGAFQIADTGQWMKMTAPQNETSPYEQARIDEIRNKMSPETILRDMMETWDTDVAPYMKPNEVATAREAYKKQAQTELKMREQEASVDPSAGPEKNVYDQDEYDALPDAVKKKQRVISISNGQVVTTPYSADGAPFPTATVGAGVAGGLGAIAGAGNLFKKFGYDQATQLALNKAKTEMGKGAVKEGGKMLSKAGIARMLPMLSKALLSSTGMVAGAGVGATGLAGAGIAAMNPLSWPGIATAVATGGLNMLRNDSSQSGQYGGWNPIGEGGDLEQAMAQLLLMGRGAGAREGLNQSYAEGQYNRPFNAQPASMWQAMTGQTPGPMQE